MFLNRRVVAHFEQVVEIFFEKIEMSALYLPWLRYCSTIRLTTQSLIFMRYRRTSRFAVDTFCQLTANTETANTESNNDLKSEDTFHMFVQKVNSIYMLSLYKGF